MADFYLAYENKPKAVRKEERKALDTERRLIGVLDETMAEVESMLLDTAYEPPNYRRGENMVCLETYREVLTRGLSAAESLAEMKAAFKRVTGEEYD